MRLVATNYPFLYFYYLQFYSFFHRGYARGQRHESAYPGILSPYSKMQLGVLDPIEITEDGTYTARASSLFPDVYKISSPYPDGEYLLIENRQHKLSDKIFLNPGFVIYHVDENVEGNGSRGGPFVSGWPGNGAHYKVAVLQADGEYELEMAKNVASADDIWTSGNSLGPGNGESEWSAGGTYPNTDSYTGGAIKVTVITIDEFTQTGTTGVWSFRVSGIPIPTDAPTNAPTDAPTPLPDDEEQDDESGAQESTRAPTGKNNIAQVKGADESSSSTISVSAVAIIATCSIAFTSMLW